MKLKNSLEGKDKKSTVRTTDQAIKNLNDFLKMKNMEQVESIAAADLNTALKLYFPSIRPQKSNDYSAQSLKCHRSALNRYFRAHRGIDITKDSAFTEANERFKATLVECKKIGKGKRKSTPVISQIDMERIAEYFDHDHMNNPDPRKLQQTVIFNIIYYFCRRGRENLYEMKLNTFEIVTEPDGTQYLIQAVDEMDKNHGIADTKKNKEGRMYSTGGNKHEFITKINKNFKIRKIKHVDVDRASQQSTMHAKQQCLILNFFGNFK